MHTAGALQPEYNALTQHRPSLNALTGLRFFLAAYVVIHHTHTGYYLRGHGHPLIGTFFLNGNIAVAQFFLLSGFILAYTYRGQIENSNDRKRFWQARFARIWPAYALSLLVSSLIMHSTPTRWLVIASLFMVQGWNPANILDAGVWNAVCWTLTVEALFYVLFPVMQRYVESLRARGLQVFIALSLFITIFCNTSPKGPGHPGYEGVFAYVPYPIIHLPEFFLGLGVGNLFLNLVAGRSVASRGLTTYIGLLFSCAVLVIPAARWTSIVMLGFALLTFGLAAEDTWLSRLLSMRALMLGGGFSYSMYLLQTPIRDAVDPYLQNSHSVVLIAGKLFLSLALVFIPMLSFLYFEEPVRRFLRSRFAALDRIRSAAGQRS